MDVHAAAKAAREHADQCTVRACHAVALALEGADRAEENRLLLAGLTDDQPDLTGIPPWSQVSRPEAGDDQIR